MESARFAIYTAVVVATLLVTAFFRYGPEIPL